MKYSPIAETAPCTTRSSTRTCEPEREIKPLRFSRKVSDLKQEDTRNVEEQKIR
jgi:hypothetical protein